LEGFIRIKKRQRVNERVGSEEDTTSADGERESGFFEVNKEQKEQIKRKLIEKYFSELPESENTRIHVINYVKCMLKNILLEKLTVSGEPNEAYPEETLLMDWILENDPQIIVDISKFWVYHAFSLSPSTNQDFYLSQLAFILRTLELNQNVIHFSAERFNDWLGFLRGLPCWTPDVYRHIKLLVGTLRHEQLSSGEGKYVSKFIETLIVSEFNLKKEQRVQIGQMLINEIVTLETEPEKYERLREIVGT
jgi:hypothetical protein